jgi:site-specific DNA-methyltransferase (cytosine-N4-specific)
MVLPLLEVIEQAGGRVRAKRAADALAERLGLPVEERRATVRTTGGKAINGWDREVRWTHQQAKLRGLTASDEPGLWSLTEAAEDRLRNARPGIVVTVYESDRGMVLWATAEAVEARLEAESINLIVTSPPYLLSEGRRKEYAGPRTEGEYVEWLAERAAAWHRALAADGSLFLNLGDCWVPGTPTQSLYQERLLLRLVDDLGYHLAEKLYWENPAKLPAPAEWVTIRRVRVTPSVEPVLWLAKGPHPKADNRRVLRPYQEGTKRMIAAGGAGPGGAGAGRRPSGYEFAADGFARDNGGSIPHSLLSISNTASNDGYLRACRASGRRPHPARFPRQLAEFCINLTTEPGDVVYDPFAGSLTTAEAAQAAGRRWLASEASREYIEGGLARLSA